MSVLNRPHLIALKALIDTLPANDRVGGLLDLMGGVTGQLAAEVGNGRVIETLHSLADQVEARFGRGAT